ncbi:MAG: LTA synthase family protein [Bacteroidota bacterium]|nr:LTA synthase family protein [Bacteroidota bacterium]
MKVRIHMLRPGKEYFIFLLPVFFIVHACVANFPLISLKDVINVLGWNLLAALLINLLFSFIFKDWRKAAIYAFSLLCFQFCFGIVHDTLKKMASDFFIVKYSFIIPFSIIVFISLFYFLQKSNRSFNRLNRYLNTLFLILLAIEAFTFLVKANKNTGISHQEKRISNKCDTCSTPDIYLIIADEYAGNRELKEIFSFDNTDFEKALEQRGFYVAKNSRSNYNYTPYSVASIVGMKYLENISSRSNDSKNRNISYLQINDNEMIRILKQYNYQFVNLSLFDFADQPTTIDNMFFLTRKKMLTAQTFTSRFKKDLGFNFITRFKVKSEIKRFTNSTLKNNKKILSNTYSIVNTNSISPRFIYTHLMMPHYPYYFDASGHPNPTESLMEEQQHLQKNYLGYLQYCNKIFLQLIDTILQKSNEPPIIIFMSDHGFRHFIPPLHQQYHFMNFNSIYLPGKNYTGFYDSISGVNQFRIILNKQFKLNLPLLKDSSSFMIEY